ncbi:MAG: PKD domain-containing protein [Dehalococcoidia bacterium]|nr:PKD domain-containing protein [Dehalococcoidia bacterium]
MKRALLIALLWLFTLAATANADVVLNRFGIVNKYPTVDGISTWDSLHWHNGVARTISGRDTPYDPTGWSQFRGSGTLKVDGQGILTMSGTEPRLYLNGVNLNPPKYWKNVEASMYYRRMVDDGTTAYAGPTIGVRSGPDGHSSFGDPCTATTYYARMRHDGKVDFRKELRHPDGVTRGTTSVWGAHGFPFSQWVGMKFVVYNIDNDRQVKLELYQDLTGGAGGGVWELLAETIDAGGWGAATGCSYPSDYIITTGGGVVFTRNTNINEAQYKWFTVREIPPTEPEANTPQVANAGANRSAVLRTAVTLDGSLSKDPDGTVASYSWNFGDGTAPAGGVKPTHTYTQVGTFTVTDNDRATGKDTATVNVKRKR